MGQRESAVVYDGLPISSGGAHSLGRTSPLAALERWRVFLAQCGTFVSVREGVFNVSGLTHLRPEPAVVAAIERRFARSRQHLFPVPPDRLDEAFALFASLEPQPRDQWGNVPVWLHASAVFCLKDPRDPTDTSVWPGQDRELFGGFETPAGARLGESSARLALGLKPAMGLLLSVPDATDDDLKVLIPWLQEALPFRLSRKHWTRWTLAKNGRTYRGRRFEPPVGAGRATHR